MGETYFDIQRSHGGQVRRQKFHRGETDVVWRPAYPFCPKDGPRHENDRDRGWVCSFHQHEVGSDGRALPNLWCAVCGEKRVSQRNYVCDSCWVPHS